MISESQERMLCVVEPERIGDVLEVCERWDVRATEIGVVTDTRRLRVFDGGEPVGDMPVEALVDDCPLYDLEPRQPAGPVYPDPPARLGAGAGARETLLALLRSPNVASKRWVFEQYDPIVGSRTARRPASADAAVLTLANDGGTGAIAVSIDGNGRRVACDPYTGAAEAVLECARNLACVGAEPLGLTNCLNFGNPEKPHIAWQLTRAVEGLRDACLALGVPVVGGNVSLYNEGAEGPIYPTPIVGMVGKLPDPERVPRIGFAGARPRHRAGGAVRAAARGVGAREAARAACRVAGRVDLAAQARALAALREAVRSGRARRRCTTSPTAAWRWRWPSAASRAAWARGSSSRSPTTHRLFGEGPGGVVIAGPQEAVRRVPGAVVIGAVGG